MKRTKQFQLHRDLTFRTWKGGQCNESHSLYQLFSLLAANNGEDFKLEQTAAVTLSRWILGVNVLE